MSPDFGPLLSTFMIGVGSLVTTVFFDDDRLASELARSPVVEEEFLVRKENHRKEAAVTEITIVEFGDLGCSCTANAEPKLKQALKEYDGKITYIYRHYPREYANPNAFIAAEATEAAGAQGKFWEMRELLMKNQFAWQRSDDPVPTFVKYAKQLDLDTAAFEKALKDHEFEDKVRQDQKDGDRVGVFMTPTFFINGRRLINPSSYQQFKAVLEQQESSKAI